MKPLCFRLLYKSDFLASCTEHQVLEYSDNVETTNRKEDAHNSQDLISEMYFQSPFDFTETQVPVTT